MLGDFFDPQSELFIEDRLRPHWSQAGGIVFITFRLRDSIPTEVLERWDREKRHWLKSRGHSIEEHWSKVLLTLAPPERHAFKKTSNRTRETFLDDGKGECVLRDRALAKIVADALMHFDGERYRMGDFVIMPNHVHLLAAFADPENLTKQCYSWLHFTARQINKNLGRTGKLWQQEPFDHLVRSVEQYEYLRKYIEDNPKKAGLTASEFVYRRYGG